MPTANHHNSFDLAFSFVLIRFAVQNCRRRSTVAGRQYGALDTDEFRMVQQDTEVNTGFQIRQRGLLHFLHVYFLIVLAGLSVLLVLIADVDWPRPSSARPGAVRAQF